MIQLIAGIILISIIYALYRAIKYLDEKEKKRFTSLQNEVDEYFDNLENKLKEESHILDREKVVLDSKFKNVVKKKINKIKLKNIEEDIKL